MIRVLQLKVPIDADTPAYIKEKLSRVLQIPASAVLSYKPVKRAIDARKKNNLFFVYNMDVCVNGDEKKIVQNCENINIYIAPVRSPFTIPQAKSDVSPVVCGMGPAGLFCAYALAKAGLNPILLERGKDVDARTADTEKFIKTRTLQPESNIQFGEGGAGTFSDGKLNTGISNERLQYVLETFVGCGAPENILYDAKPHIGTDVLRTVIKNIRKEIIALGGEVHFETKLTDLRIQDGKLCAVEVENEGEKRSVDCEALVLAIGHSARDTFEMLYRRKLNMEQKQFSMGVRIEHKQHTINMAQYGTDALGAADYKLAVRTEGGRGVYTFCMCPGGYVVAAASEEGGVVTNGMSYHARNGENANAALLCDVYPSDFESDHPLAGVYLQRKYEQLAYICGGKNYSAPATLVGDFLKDRTSTGCGKIDPTYKPNVHWCNIADCLPDYITVALREALPLLGRKLKGFDDGDAVLTAIESRSSSPVRILRSENLESNISGIYPCGEGAGYAGGIMSAAADGLRVATVLIEQYIARNKQL